MGKRNDLIDKLAEILESVKFQGGLSTIADIIGETCSICELEIIVNEAEKLERY